MDIIPVILFAVSSNIDSLILGISLGMRGINLDITSNTIISSVTFIFTVVSMYLGRFLSDFLPEHTAVLAGNITLIMIGIYYIQKYFLKKREEFLYLDDKSEFAEKRILSMKQSFILALMLSINNFGLGIGASISGLSLYLGAAFSLAVGFLFLNSANLLGKNLVSKIFGEYGELISGIFIVILGIYQFVL